MEAAHRSLGDPGDWHGYPLTCSLWARCPAFAAWRRRRCDRPRSPPIFTPYVYAYNHSITELTGSVS